MKIRNGFVTNSSSSSFIIGKKEPVYLLKRAEPFNVFEKVIPTDIYNHKNYELNYYFSNIEFLIDDPNSCENCPTWLNRLCGKDHEIKEKCKRTKKAVQEIKPSKENATLLMLGKILVRSDCGYMNENIISALYQEANFGCNHMG